ncbi:MAG: IS66 family transposase [Planctomycetes bacterium]|nr:IS66 family transposase [Planctomycetota bacterium]
MDDNSNDRRIRELEAENRRLRGDNESLKAENDQLRQLIKPLQERIEQLERQAARQAAPFRCKDKDRKPPEKHGKPGRKPGHPPAHREEPPQIDDHVEVRLTGCPCCGGPVKDLEPCEQFIEDLPPTRPHVTRLVTYVGTCPRCGEVRSTHPMQVSTATGAAKVHLGARALGLAALLNKHLGLTTRSTCRVLETLCGLRITPGGLTQAMHRVADKAKGSFLELLAGLRSQPTVYADETSWWVSGPRWLWTFTTPDRTIYRVERSRGKAVVFDTLGAHFGGVLVSDCLASYENLPFIMHKCYGHHLQAIAQARDRKPEDQRSFFHELTALLRSAMALDRLRHDLPPPEFARIRQHLDDRADLLLGPTRNDPDEERVANRLRKRRRWLFTFLDYAGVEATNNRAERALRPAVIARKLSCGNKTERGKRTWEILASLAATCHQRDEDLVEHLRPYLLLPPSAKLIAR